MLFTFQMTEALIQLIGAGVYYPPRGFAKTGTWALRDVSVTLSDGDRIVVTGDNGSGKTTLLRVLCGTQPLSEGTRAVRSKALLGNWGLKKSLIKTSLATQQVSDGVIGEFTVADNLILRRLSFTSERASKQSLYKRGKEFLSQTGFLTPLADAFFEPAARLSGGWQQLLQIASVVYANPKLVLLDEPANHLSKENAENVYRLLSQLARDVTIVCVTHARDDAVAPFKTTQRWVLSRGTIK